MGGAYQEGSSAHAHAAGGATADALLALSEAASEVREDTHKTPTNCAVRETENSLVEGAA